MDNIKDKKIPNVPNLRFGLEEFKPTKIKNLLTICNGQDQKKIENENGKNPILGTGGIIGYTNSYLYDKPSVCIGRKGTIDKPIFIDKPFWTVDTLFWSKINSAFNPKFIYYLFQTINWKFYNQSTSVPSLTSAVIENIGVNVPNIRTQNKIADFLSKIDEQINTQIKIIEDLKTYKNSINQLMISQSMDKIKLKDVCRFEEKTKHQSRDGLSDGEYPFFTNEESQTKYFDSYDYDGEYIIANTGGKANFKYYKGKFAVMSDCLVIKIHNQYLTKFYFNILQVYQSLIDHLGFEGSGLQHLNKEWFLNLQIPKNIENKNLFALVQILQSKIDNELILLEKYKEQKKYLLSNMFI